MGARIGVSIPHIIDLGERLMRSKRPLVLAGGLPLTDSRALATAMAVNLLEPGKTGDFGPVGFQSASGRQPGRVGGRNEEPVGPAGAG